MRLPEDGLVAELEGRAVGELLVVGDCLAPATIAHAVYSGYRAALEWGAEVAPPRRERTL
jgi:hypothetical protein